MISLLEVFGKPYNLHLMSSSYSQESYRFFANGVPYMVSINRGDGHAEVLFAIELRYWYKMLPPLPGEKPPNKYYYHGDKSELLPQLSPERRELLKGVSAVRVFASVKDVVFRFLKKSRDLKTLYFQSNTSDSSRTSLYDRMAKKLAREFGMTLAVADVGKMRTFILSAHPTEAAYLAISFGYSQTIASDYRKESEGMVPADAISLAKDYASGILLFLPKGVSNADSA